MFAVRSNTIAVLRLSLILVILLSALSPISAEASPLQNAESNSKSSGRYIDHKTEFESPTSSSLKTSILPGNSANAVRPSPQLQSGDQCVLPPSGLIDWWTADGNANDVVGTHHGTPVGGVTYVPGKVGQAFSFDGVDDSVDLGSWFTSQEFTISMWVKPGATQQTYADIIDNNHRTNENWVVQQNGNTLNQYYFSYAGPVTLTSNEWQHLAFSHDSFGNYRVYVNGALIQTNNAGAINYSATSPFLRLARWGGGGRNWKGEMDEIDLYSRPLNLSEVYSLYEAGTYGKCRNVESQFNSDTDGWTIIGDGNSPAFFATGGVDNGGYISSTDLGQGSYWYWNAPAKFLGNKLKAYNGNLRFYLKQSSTDSQSDQDDIKLSGGGTTLIYNTPSNPGVTWTYYTIPFNEIGWKNQATGLSATQQQFLTVLGNIQSLNIRGEYRVGADTGGIDSVVLAYPSQDVLNCQNSNLVIPDGAMCILDAGLYTYTSIEVQSGGALYLRGNTTSNSGVQLQVENLTIGAAGKIDASGMGYPSTTTWNGTGGGAGGGGYATGAGHGGMGVGGNGGNIYGSVAQPVELGSGGGNSNGCVGGSGGGAIWLQVSSMLALDGDILADGSASGCSNGGSGGSIRIETTALSGNGTIHANGGTQAGGGRIALSYTTSTFALDGQHVYARGGGSGGPGTVYMTNTSTGMDKLLVDNGSNTTSVYAALPAGTYEYDAIELTHKGVLRVLGSNSNLTIGEQTIIGDGTGRLEAEGLLYTPQNLTLTNVTLGILGSAPETQTISLSGSGNLDLYASSPLTSGTYSFDSITVGSERTLKLIAYNNGDTDYTNDRGIHLQVANLTVAATGKIDTSGTGYPSTTVWNGIGGGPGGGGFATGGGYGGNGTGGNGGRGHGSITQPIALGSGGGNTNGCVGGTGAGAVWVQVSGILSLDGEILADGTNGGCSYGGSGGSILVETATITGNGVIHANGGAQAGGGRIAISYISSTFPLDGQHVYASGGTNGGPGTVYLKNNSTGLDKLLIDNANKTTSTYAVLPVDLYEYDAIELTRKSVVRVLGSASELTIGDQALVGDGTGRLEVEGLLHAPQNLTLSNVALSVLGDFSGSPSVSLGVSSRLELYGSSTLNSGVFTLSDLSISNGAVLRLISYNNGNTIYTDDHGVTLNVNNLTLSLGGKIDASGTGYVCPAIEYSHGTGPGAGQFGTGSPDWFISGGGGGYGGRGQDSTGAGGGTYGSVTQPVDLGSSGGTGRYHYGGPFVGGAGGGAIHIVASGTMIVDGDIASDGNPGTGIDAATGGGGSGGSIWIETNSLLGSGLIHANGGASPAGGKGGGGRIAVYAENSSHTIAFAANGGMPGYEVTGKGTVYLDAVDPAKSAVEISPSPVLADDVSPAIITVTVRNGSDVPIPDKPVKLSIVSGLGLKINGQPVAPNQSYLIGNTDSNGIVQASLTAIKSGSRTISAQAGQESILQQGIVEFSPGAISRSASLIDVNPAVVAANGTAASEVTVTVLDANWNPIPGVAVTLQADKSAVVVQPTAVTDDLGKATGKITDTVVETVTVMATAIQDQSSVPLEASRQVTFKGVDLSLNLSAPAQAPAGVDIQYPYVVSVNNSNYLDAPNTVLQITLPSNVNYSGSTSELIPTVEGQVITWNLGTINAGAKVSFTFYAKISPSLPVGESLSTNGLVFSSTSEENQANNASQIGTTLINGFTFTGSVTPNTQPLAIGAEGNYEIAIQNTGLLADVYEISITKLAATQYALSQTELTLSPQQSGELELAIHIDSCNQEGVYQFDVNITSRSQNETKVYPAVAVVQAAPVLSELRPGNAETIGSRDATISWHSDVATTGMLTIYPVADPQNVQRYPTVEGIAHSVVVQNLLRNTSYAWYVSATSLCDTTTSSVRQFTVGNGVVFQNHQQSYTIKRDYDQLVDVLVTNQDNKPHEIQVEVQDTYEDLIVNFRGSGSLQEKVTLLPGESRSVQLAIFAQDAMLHDYSFSAILTSDDGTNIITDLATVNIKVLFPGDYELREISTDPILNVTTYEVVNNGLPITDLYIRAVDPVTELPAPVYITPQIVHARLDTGQSLRFKVIPLYYTEGLTNTTGNASQLKVFAAPDRIDLDSAFTLVSEVAGIVQKYQAQKSCDNGRSVYPVTLSGVVLRIPFTSWYCTNRPNIDISINLPPFVNSSNILGATLEMGFSPVSAMRPHDTKLLYNNHEIGLMENQVPNGNYKFQIDPNDIATNPFGGASQTISLRSTHNNNGGDEPHHVSQVGGTLYVALDEVTIYVCANSQEEANRLARDAYGIVDLPFFFNINIRKPFGSPQTNADGSINLQAYLTDSNISYINYYNVEAELRYLDEFLTPSEEVILFDDGLTVHGDASRNDRYFNALWFPKHDGRVEMTVRATAPDGRVETAVTTFTVVALPDLTVSKVYVEEVSLINNEANVIAEISNLGLLPVTGPVWVEFRYYRTNEQGNPTTLLFTSRQPILTGDNFGKTTLNFGESIPVVDTNFIPTAFSVYYVSVVVDP